MPKGGASSLTPVYAGLQEDLDDFLKAWLAQKTRRFSDYKELFKSRGMVQIFNGRGNSAEIIEFNEYLLVYCLPFMEKFSCFNAVRTLEERLFGLYSLYTFFYLQEAGHVVKIRMDPDAANNFQSFMEIMNEEKIYEGLMASLKLIEDRAFRYVAFIQMHDPSCFKRFYTDKKVSGVPLLANINDPLSNVKSLIESNIFDKLSLVHQVYTDGKEKLGIQTPKGTFELKNLQNWSREIVGKIEKDSEVEVKNGVEMVINTDYSIEHIASRGMQRSEIKEKAYGADLHLTRSRRHRTSVPLAIPSEAFDFERSSPEPEKPKKSHPKRGRKRKIPETPIKRDFEYFDGEEEQIEQEIPEKKTKRAFNRKIPVVQDSEDQKIPIPEDVVEKSEAPEDDVKPKLRPRKKLEDVKISKALKKEPPTVVKDSEDQEIPEDVVENSESPQKDVKPNLRSGKKLEDVKVVKKEPTATIVKDSEDSGILDSFRSKLRSQKKSDDVKIPKKEPTTVVRDSEVSETPEVQTSKSPKKELPAEAEEDVDIFQEEDVTPELIHPEKPEKKSPFILPNSAIIDSQELQSPPLQTMKPSHVSTRISVEDTHEVTTRSSDGEDPFGAPLACSSPIPSATKSIIKKKIKKEEIKNRNHVSFAEKTNGELDNEVHEIPCRDEEEDGPEQVEVHPEPFQSVSTERKIAQIDDSDMFTPLENEEEMRLAMEQDGFDISSGEDSELEIDEEML